MDRIEPRNGTSQMTNRGAKRVLVGYEYGLGMGHIARMLPIARTLSDRGHQVLFFLYNARECARIISRERLPVIAAMDMTVRVPEMRHPPRFSTYSDFMALAGSYYQDHLFTATLFWKTLFDLYRPDLIVCDNSPNCCLAAFGRIPVVLLGDGFTLPPAQDAVFPSFQNAPAVIEPDLLLQNMRAVQKRHGFRQPETITEPFRTEARLFCTLPEMDHYTLMRRDVVIGPPPNDVLAPVPAPAEPSYFAYLKMECPTISDVLDSLSATNLPGELYVSGLPSEWEARLIRWRAIVHRDPPPIDEVLARASVVVHHGGNGLACAALSAGRPQLILPLYQETELTGETLSRIGVCHRLTPEDAKSGRTRHILSRMVHDSDVASRAQSIARSIESRGPWRFMESCIETCDRILKNCG